MRRKSIITFAVLALLAALVGASASIVAAETLHSQTIDVDQDTEALRVLGENITNDTASVTITEHLDGTQTQVLSSTLNTSTTTMDSVELSTINANASYEVVVTGDGADSISVNEVQVIPAAGGSTSSSSSWSIATLTETQQIALIGAIVFFGSISVLWIFRDRLGGY